MMSADVVLFCVSCSIVAMVVVADVSSTYFNTAGANIALCMNRYEVLRMLWKAIIYFVIITDCRHVLVKGSITGEYPRALVMGL